MFFSPQAALRLKGVVGNGRDNDSEDVLRVKRAFGRLGRYPQHEADLHGFIDQDLTDAIRRFQQDRGLVGDGWMRPDGPTHRNLSRDLIGGSREPAVTAADIALIDEIGASRPNREGDIRTVKKALNRLGLYPYDTTDEPDPFIDAPLDKGIRTLQARHGLKVDGWMAPDGETENVLRHQVAALAPHKPRTPPGSIEEANAVKPAIDFLKKVPWGAIMGPILNPEGPKHPQPDPVPQVPNKLENIPVQPSEPTIEQFPSEPLPDFRVPGFTPADRPNIIEIYPDQRDELPQAIIVERRGSERIRVFNSDIIRLGEEISHEDKLTTKHDGGARDGDGNEKKEPYLRPPGGGRKGGSYLDGAFVSKETGRYLYINTVDVRSDGETMATRETQAAVRILVNKTTGDILVTMTKPPEGMEWDRVQTKEFLRPFLREIDKPHDAGKGLSTDRWHHNVTRKPK